MPRARKGTIKEQQTRDRCNKIRSMLRRAWSKDPKRLQCLKDNRRKYVGDNKRQRFEHECNICKNWYKQDEMQIDHIVPAGSFLELTPKCIGEFAYKLFEGRLQKLCKACHKIKTKEERAAK
jgi:hypothetical protein